MWAGARGQKRFNALAVIKIISIWKTGIMMALLICIENTLMYYEKSYL